MTWTKQEGSQFNMWMPEKENDELVGEVLLVEEGTYGKQYVIKTESGEEKVTPSHKVLQNRMSKVEAGNKVKVVYKGDEPPKVRGDNPMKMYEVFIDK